VGGGGGRRTRRGGGGVGCRGWERVGDGGRGGGSSRGEGKRGRGFGGTAVEKGRGNLVGKKKGAKKLTTPRSHSDWGKGGEGWARRRGGSYCAPSAGRRGGHCK